MEAWIFISSYAFGQTSIEIHRISTQDEVLIKSRAYRLSAFEKPILKKT